MFRPDDPLKYAEFISFLVRFLEKDTEKRKKLSMSECLKKADELKLLGDKERSKEYKQSFGMVKTVLEKEKYEVARGDNISRAEVYAGLSHFMDIAGGIESDLPSGLDIHPVH